MLEIILEALRVSGVNDQVSDQVSDQVARLIAALRTGSKSAAELMRAMGLSHRPTFRKNYLHPAMSAGLVEMTRPESPTAKNQKYRLAVRGEGIGRCWIGSGVILGCVERCHPCRVPAYSMKHGAKFFGCTFYRSRIFHCPIFYIICMAYSVIMRSTRGDFRYIDAHESPKAKVRGYTSALSLSLHKLEATKQSPWLGRGRMWHYVSLDSRVSWLRSGLKVVGALALVKRTRQ